MSTKDHWQTAYQRSPETAVSWYQPRLARSLAAIQRFVPGHETRIVDVGGGASTLVDHLLEAGYHFPMVLDLSHEALAVARRRLGAEASRAGWLVADATRLPLAGGSCDLWHDRAVLHFLVTPEDRRLYCAELCRVLRPGGAVLIATFGPGGPDHCSGLPVRRYSSEELSAVLGPSFEPLHSELEIHVTPGNRQQEFCYTVFRFHG